jgi:hypothetical protein
MMAALRPDPIKINTLYFYVCDHPRSAAGDTLITVTTTDGQVVTQRYCAQCGSERPEGG